MNMTDYGSNRFLKRSGSSSHYISCGLRLSGPEMDAKTWSALLENALTDDRLSTSLQLEPSCGDTCGPSNVDLIITSLQVHLPPNHHEWVDMLLKILLPLVAFVEGAE